jgi:hypothetical protein
MNLMVFDRSSFSDAFDRRVYAPDMRNEIRRSIRHASDDPLLYSNLTNSSGVRPDWSTMDWRVLRFRSLLCIGRVMRRSGSPGCLRM